MIDLWSTEIIEAMKNIVCIYKMGAVIMLSENLDFLSMVLAEVT